MQADTTLTLGDFVFAKAEIPEAICFGGEQRIVVHELVGGARVVDALGRSDKPLSWQGVLLGENALARARYLDGLRIAGKALALSWSELAYNVIVRSFECNFERFYQLPYRISCEVIEDFTLPILDIASPGIDDLIGDDMNLAGSLINGLNNPTLSALFGALSTAMRGISSFATATQAVLNTVLHPLADLRTYTGVLLTQINGVTQNVATVGGVLPNTSVARQSHSLLTQTNAMTQTPQLLQLDAVLGRMGGTLTR